MHGVPWRVRCMHVRMARAHLMCLVGTFMRNFIIDRSFGMSHPSAQAYWAHWALGLVSFALNRDYTVSWP